MKHSHHTLSTLAIGAALVAGPGIASAGAIGTGYLGIFDIIFYKTDGATRTILLADGSGAADIRASGAGFTNSGDTNATLNGASVSRSDSIAATPAGFDVPAPGFSCVGADACNGYGDDSFVYLTQPSDVPGASYAVSDVNLLGAAVNLGQGDANVGADAKVLAESAVNPNDVGTAQTNLNLNARFEFIANGDFDFEVEGDFEAYLRAALIGDLDGVDANAEIGWSFTIRDVTDGLLFSYDLNDDDEWQLSTTSASAPGDDFEEEFDGSFGFSTIGVRGGGETFLQTGNQYQVTVTHTGLSDSQALRIPEPASLGLLGIGLLGLGALRRHRRS